VKVKFAILALAFVALLAVYLVPAPVKAATIYGPRVDEILVKIYSTETAEFNAFEAQEIDLIDWPIGSDLVTRWSSPPYNSYIALDYFREIGLYEFDINNNASLLSYPESVYGRSPTSYPEFRKAIAYMVDKAYIVSQIVGGLGAVCESPIMPWLRWYDPTMPTYNYDPARACQILYQYGWRDSPDPNVYCDVKFPPGHLKAGQYLKDVLKRNPSDPGLIFYRRSDDTRRSLAGQLLIYGDATHLGLEDIGIPVEDLNVPRGTCSPNVMYKKDFHIYTGGWSLSRDPDYLYDLWHSSAMNWDITEFAWNYDNIQDGLWDLYIERVKYAKDLEEAEYYSHLACQRFGEMVFFIPLWTTVGYMAHNKAWHVLNVDSFGVRNWWNLYCTNNPSIGPTGGTLRWGFKSDVEQLNVIYSQWVWDWQILDKIFDSLIAMNPLNIAVDMPWMAKDWKLETWTIPETGELASKITFTLRSGIKWVNATNGAVIGTVTPEDVKFSFQYVYDHVGWNYPAVADLYVNPDGTLKIEISGDKITFYENVLSCWAMHWVGGLPIIPKSVYQNILDPHGFTPGNLGPEKTLIGSGAFYFVSYTPGVSAVLRANRNYFAPIVPNVDTDPSRIKIDWGIFKGNAKSGDWTVNVLDMIVVATAIGWTGPPGDIPADINKDGKVNVLDLINVATNLGASWF